jgi:uncharacterized membrane protein
MVTVDRIRWAQEASHTAWSSAFSGRPVNVGDTERLASGLGGGVLLALGVLKGGPKGLLMAGLGGAMVFRGVTGYCGLYQAIGASTACRGQANSVPAQTGVRVEEAITIDRSPEEVYRFWNDPANLPRFLTHVKSVTAQGPDRQHWVQFGPWGQTIAWDAEIHNRRPNQMIAWRSLEGSDIDVAGSVHFDPAPGGRGTIVRVNEKLNPPVGKVGMSIATLLGHNPESVTRENLRRLKQLLEVGEIATVSGQTSGRG